MKTLCSVILLFLSLNFIDAINPFLGKNFYVNPTFQVNIDKTISAATDSQTISNLKIARNAPSAYWLDVMSKVQPDSTSLDSMNGILADAAKSNPAKLTVFIVYDLPNRDCAAIASNGELCCSSNADGTCNYNAGGLCETGLQTYKSKYIDNIVTILKKYPQSPVVLIIEPDSLPNLITNLGNPRCSNQATQAAYKQGITYAVEQIAQNAPNVAMYLDSGHGGWLGWQNNAQPFQVLIQSLGILSKLRGFATNVANYQPLGVACPAALWCLPNNGHTNDLCCADPCNIVSQYNPAPNELNYVLELASLFPGKYYIIDTGRNGIPNARTTCANWCNPRNMGLGTFPTSNTALASIDAYYWLKTPAESDGCTQQVPDGTQCKRFDSMCASADSIGSKSGEPRMPEAGTWSIYQAQMLAKNAVFGTVPSNPPTPVPSVPPVTPVPSNPPVTPVPSNPPSPVPSIPSNPPSPVPSSTRWKCETCKWIST